MKPSPPTRPWFKEEKGGARLRSVAQRSPELTRKFRRGALRRLPKRAVVQDDDRPLRVLLPTRLHAERDSSGEANIRSRRVASSLARLSLGRGRPVDARCISNVLSGAGMADRDVHIEAVTADHVRDVQPSAALGLAPTLDLDFPGSNAAKLKANTLLAD